MKKEGITLVTWVPFSRTLYSRDSKDGGSFPLSLIQKPMITRVEIKITSYFQMRFLFYFPKVSVLFLLKPPPIITLAFLPS